MGGETYLNAGICAEGLGGVRLGPGSGLQLLEQAVERQDLPEDRCSHGSQGEAHSWRKRQEPVRWENPTRVKRPGSEP